MLLCLAFLDQKKCFDWKTDNGVTLNDGKIRPLFSLLFSAFRCRLISTIFSIIHFIISHWYTFIRCGIFWTTLGRTRCTQTLWDLPWFDDLNKFSIQEMQAAANSRQMVGFYLLHLDAKQKRRVREYFTFRGVLHSKCLKICDKFGL